MAKMLSKPDLKVACVVESWQYVSSFALDKKVDYEKINRIPLTLCDFFSLFEHVVSLLDVDWTEHCADPYDEFVISGLEELNVRVHLVVDSHRKLYSQLRGELVHEVLNVFGVLLVMILFHCLHNLVKQLLFNRVLSLNAL